MLLPHKYQVASVCLSVTILLRCSYNKTESQPQEEHLAVSTLVYLNIPLCSNTGEAAIISVADEDKRVSGVLRSFQTFLKATLPSNGTIQTRPNHKTGGFSGLYLAGRSFLGIQ